MKTLAVSLVLAASSVAFCAAHESRVSVAESTPVHVHLVAATSKEKNTKNPAPAPNTPSPEKPKSPAAPPREQKPAPPAVLFM